MRSKQALDTDTLTKISSILLVTIFGTVLLLFLIFNFLRFKNILLEQIREDGEIKSRLLATEENFRNNVRGRTNLINIYGASLNILNWKIVGNFDFVKDDHNIIQRTEKNINQDNFITSMKQLNEYCKEIQTPLVFLSLPDKTRWLELAASDEFLFDGQLSKEVGRVLLKEQIDCIEIDQFMQSASNAPTFDEFYLKTDVHLSTYAEFWMAKELVNYLQEEYRLEFNDEETVFNLDNYMISSYDFIGNTARSAGEYFSGTDQFEIYKPNFETNITLNNPSTFECKTGGFESVVLNGYENQQNINKYIYWVTNYGHFTSPYYQYINNNITEDKANVLIICDSLFMRGFSYLTLTCHSVTVLDPRYFGGMEYVSQILNLDHYDSVIVVGSSSSFYNSEFSSKVELPNFPTKKMISEEEYGEWIANNGICVDSYNNIQLKDRTIITLDSTATIVNLCGWAADFCNDAPFQELYLQVGNILIKCDYMIERISVSDHFKKESLLKTGFQITFPASYLKNGAVRDISFVGVSADGKYLYEPVVYQLDYL